MQHGLRLELIRSLRGAGLALGVSLPFVALALGCGGAARQEGNGTFAGGPSGGSSGAGVAGEGGVSAGAAAGAVNPATAGSGVGGKLDGPGPECTSDSDCKIADDCCSCAAVPVNQTPAACHSVCIQSACAARGVPLPAARCVVGQCVVGFDCDSSQVVCKSVTPSCPQGQVPLVSGGCWQGGCAPASECARVADCSACTGPLDSMTCVMNVASGTRHCVDLPAGCSGQCSCLAASVCARPDECSDLSGIHGVSCGLK